jgi:hypothetical protein
MMKQQQFAQRQAGTRNKTGQTYNQTHNETHDETGAAGASATNPIFKSLMATALLGAFALAGQGHAQAQEGLPITVSGFGTGALTRTDNDGAEFTRLNQVNGAAKDWRTGVDSNLGLQVTAKWSDTISFTAQGLVRKYGVHDDYQAELAWAFAKFKLNEDFSLRVGRIGMPVYFISDVRNVGYANTMLRPPTEMYRQVTFDSADGGDITYQHSFGDNTVTAQFAVGNAKVRSSDGYKVDFKPVIAAQVLLERGPFTYRIGHARTEFTVGDNPRLDSLSTTLGALRLTNALNELAYKDVKGQFNSVGISMDYNNIVGLAEYAKRKSDSRLVQDTTSWYAMLGYRFGKVLPYYVHGDVKQDSARQLSSLPASGPLTAGVNSLIRAGLQTTDGVGVRWDFYKSAALKVQVDRVNTRDGNGYFANAKPGFAGSTVNVYAAAIDFVF